MDYTENFDDYDYELAGGRRRKRRSNVGKKRSSYRVRSSSSGKLRKRRSNSGKSRSSYRIRCKTSGKLRKRRSNVGKKRRSYKSRKVLVQHRKK